MFIQFVRKLPRAQQDGAPVLVPVLVNSEMVLWAQEYEEGYVTLFVDNGPEILVKGSLAEVQKILQSTL